MKALPFVLAAAFLCGCDDSGPTAPDIDVRGSYTLTELSFDPQGSLPAMNLVNRITQTTIPRLVLATNNRAQLVAEDPATGLITTANASFTVIDSTHVRVTFDQGSTMHQSIFLSQRMTFTYDPATRSLTFDGASPDGIARARLLQAVPEWQQEQLLDPVPGTLHVAFRSGTS
jgi:hypothetical protein